MELKAYLSVLLFILFGQALSGQSTTYQFSHLDTKDGLSNNQVNCIFKDSKGF
jgi:hypothetical protein